MQLAQMIALSGEGLRKSAVTSTDRQKGFPGNTMSLYLPTYSKVVPVMTEKETTRKVTSALLANQQ